MSHDFWKFMVHDFLKINVPRFFEIHSPRFFGIQCPTIFCDFGLLSRLAQAGGGGAYYMIFHYQKHTVLNYYHQCHHESQSLHRISLTQWLEPSGHPKGLGKCRPLLLRAHPPSLPTPPLLLPPLARRGGCSRGSELHPDWWWRYPPEWWGG